MAEAGKVEAMVSGPKTAHFIAILKKGSKWSAEENESTRKLLQDHISNVWKLHQDGALKFYGAFDDAGDIRGFAILQAKSLGAAKELLKNDPAVKAKLRERYGSRVPTDEPVISPGAQFASPLLETVVPR